MNFLFRQPSMPAASELLPGRAEPIVDPAPHFLSGRALTPPYPAGLEILDVGMGCYWGAEKKFWSIPGVWVTAVGFQGGETPNPTYRETCTGHTGHAEVVRVVFDPAVVTYEQLLKVFWENHDPTQGFRQGNDTGTQYRSAIFAHGDAQLAAAIASRDAYQPELTRAGYKAITTDIREAPAFFFAEDEHQQYLAKNPDGYDCHTATGVACPIGLGVHRQGAPPSTSRSPLVSGATLSPGSATVVPAVGAERRKTTMAEHPNVALLRRALQAMTEQDMSKADQEMAIVDAFMADDIIWHEIGRAEPRRGKAELRAAMMEGARDSTIAYEIHDVIANDDHAIAIGTATATRGGSTLVYRTAEIFHIRDGRAVERWAFSDDTAAIAGFFA